MMSVSVIKLEDISEQRGFSSTVYRNSSNRNSIVENTSFLAESLHKEVMNQKRLSGKTRKLKYLKKIHKGYISILTAVMMASPATVLAQDVDIYQNMMTPVSSDQEITPNLIMQWGMSLSFIAVAIGIAVASSLLAIAGIYRMLRKEKESVEWTTDIIKGLVQVLIAIPVVYSLFYLAQIVFKRIPFLEGLM